MLEHDAPVVVISPSLNTPHPEMRSQYIWLNTAKCLLKGQATENRVMPDSVPKVRVSASSNRAVVPSNATISLARVGSKQVAGKRLTMNKELFI